MPKQLYRYILADAWRTVWQHKQLWFWGLFAGLLGNAGEYQFLLNAVDTSTGKTPLAAPFPTDAPLLGQAAGLWGTITTDPLSVLFLLLVGLVIVGVIIFFLWLSMVSVGALVKSSAAVADGDPALSLVDGMKAGQASFGPVLVSIMFGRVVVWLILGLVMLLASLTALDYYIGLPMFFVGFLVLVPALFVVSFVMRFTVVDVVLRRRSLLVSLEQAIDLFRRHWLITAELAFFLFVLTTLAGLVMVGVMAITAIPALISSLVLWQAGAGLWAALMAMLAIALFLAVLLPVGAMISAFQWAAWTHLYVRLKEKGHLSKIVRVMTRFFGARLANPRRA